MDCNIYQSVKLNDRHTWFDESASIVDQPLRKHFPECWICGGWSEFVVSVEIPYPVKNGINEADYAHQMLQYKSMKLDGLRIHYSIDDFAGNVASCSPIEGQSDQTLDHDDMTDEELSKLTLRFQFYRCLPPGRVTMLLYTYLCVV